MVYKVDILFRKARPPCIKMLFDYSALESGWQTARDPALKLHTILPRA